MGAVGEGVHLLNAKQVEISLVYITAANDGDNQTIAGTPGDRSRQFAFASLTIHPALAGDDNVAILDGGVKVEQVEEELCALDIAPGAGGAAGGQH